MEPLFFLIRLPFFAVGLVLCIAWDIVLFPLLILAHAGWVLWIVVARMIGFPFRLIGASWQNDAKILTSGLEDKFKEVSTSWANWFSDYFANVRHICHWQMHGSK